MLCWMIVWAVTASAQRRDWIPVSNRDFHDALQSSAFSSALGKQGDFRLDSANPSPRGTVLVLSLTPLSASAGLESRRILLDVAGNRPWRQLPDVPVVWADDQWLFFRGEGVRFAMNVRHPAHEVPFPPEVYVAKTSPFSSIAWDGRWFWFSRGHLASNSMWYCLAFPPGRWDFQDGPPVIERCEALGGWLVSARDPKREWVTSHISDDGEIQSTVSGRLLPTRAVHDDQIVLSDSEGVSYAIYRMGDSLSKESKVATLPSSVSPISSSPDASMFACYPVHGRRLSRFDEASQLLFRKSDGSFTRINSAGPFFTWLPVPNRLGLTSAQYPK